jgi:hypothetical protein
MTFAFNMSVLWGKGEEEEEEEGEKGGGRRTRR